MRYAILTATLAIASIPFETALVAQTGRQVVSHILEEPGWVGITPDSIDPLTIALVAAGTPAAAAGLLPGDRIVSIDGSTATSRRLFQRHFPIGQAVRLGVVRGDRRVGTFTFAAVENPYAAYLAALAREDSILREARVYRLELARSAAAPAGVDTTRVRGTGDFIWYPRSGEDAGSRERPLEIIDGVIAGAPVRAAARPRTPSGTGTIVGRLTDSDRGTAIESAVVEVTGTSLSATTGVDGRYRITGVPAGTHTVQATRIGYARASVGSVTVVAGAETTVDLVLPVRTLQLRRVVVAGADDPTHAGRPTTVARPEPPPAVSGEFPSPLASRLSEGATAVSGATLETLNPTLGEYFGVREGVFVLRVASGSPAASAGLQPGDVIESVNGRRVLTLEAVTSAVGDARGAITLSVLRRGQRVAVPLRR